MSLLQAIGTGILIGGLYALIASGLNIIYGVMRVVNFAHGYLMILAAYVAFWLWTYFGIGPVEGLLVLIPLFFLIGVGLYYLTVVPLLDSDDVEMMSFLAYFGLGIIILSGIRILWSSQPRAIPTPYEDVLPIAVDVAGATFPVSRLIGALVAFITIAFLIWFLYNTFYGKAIRALIQNREATQFLGIDIHRVSAISFGLGLALAAVAGALVTLIFPGFNPVMGEEYTIIAFAIIVLGGLGDPIGALAAGMVFALIEQIAMLYLPLTAGPLLAFVLLVLIIMVRPEGIFRISELREVMNRFSGLKG